MGSRHKRQKKKMGAPTKAAHARDSQDRRDALRLKLRVTQAQRNLDNEIKRLRNFDPNPAPLKKIKKGKKGPEDWVLRGPARPAALVARIAAGEVDQDGNEFIVPDTIDLLEENEGKLWECQETRHYITLTVQLAEAHAISGNLSQAIAVFNQCLELDSEDHVGARHGLVNAFLNNGSAAEARNVIEKYPNDKSTVFQFSRLLIELIAFVVLKEEDSSEEIARNAFQGAFAVNPYIVVFLNGFDVFTEVVEYVDEIKEPQSGSIEEAFVYCSKYAGMWLESEGVIEWMRTIAAEYPSPKCDESSCSDPMYLGMYETAVEMLMEDNAD